jgi:hypothetical protein
VLAALAALVVAGTVSIGIAPGTSAASAFSYTVTVSPATELADGQLFTVRVSGPPGMTVLNSGFCSPDLPADAVDRDLTEWCTDTVGNGKAGGYAPADPDGVAELILRAGVGNATKTAPALGTTHSWTCGPGHPCKLPIVIVPPDGDAVFDVSTSLTYRDDDPTAGCGGKAADQVASSAPDRLTEQWVSWAVGECGDHGLTTSASFENDGRSLGEFADGSVDLAYTAVAPGTPGFGEAGRAAVATPVALNATVIAAAGFVPSASSVPGQRIWRHITDVKMTEAEATSLLSGHLSLDEDLQNALIARNPQLASQTGAIGFTAPSALAGPQAATYLTSRRFAARSPKTWTYPSSKSKYGDQAGTPLGTFADYNALTNSLAMVNLSSGKPQFVGEIYRKLSEKPEAISLVTFYLTDLATARQLGLAPVAIGSDEAGYVLPTTESITKAAEQLKPDASGFALPSVGDLPAGAYPLAYAEYAVTPAQKLLDDRCKERTGELAALKRWLTYLTTSGQDPSAFAASGLIPLTPALQAQAASSIASIAKVAPSTGPCGSNTSTPTPTTTTPGGGPLGGNGDVPLGGDLGSIPGSGLDPSSLEGADSSVGSTTTTGTAKRATAKSTSRAEEVVSRTSIPRLASPLGSPVVAGAVTLPALVGLASFAGFLTTDRPAGIARLRRRRATSRGSAP